MYACACIFRYVCVSVTKMLSIIEKSTHTNKKYKCIKKYYNYVNKYRYIEFMSVIIALFRVNITNDRIDKRP